MIRLSLPEYRAELVALSLAWGSTTVESLTVILTSYRWVTR